MIETKDLYLASKSPRRRELLEQIGVCYGCVDVDVPEQREPHETAEQYVCRLAESKARAGGDKTGGNIPVLGSDTIVVCAGQVLEKPSDEADAVSMLLALSARQHQVLTAVSLCSGERSETRLQTTAVWFRAITEAEARAYWRTGEPKDKAGGYGIQGFGAIFVARIEGSYSGVMGLPLHETWELLRDFNVPVWLQCPGVDSPA